MFLIRRYAGLAFALLTVFAASPALATTYYADINGGNWAVNTTWHTVSNSGPLAPVGSYPGSAAGDVAIMDFQGEVINVTTAVPFPVTLQEGNVSMFLNINAGGTLTLTGASFVSSGAVLVLNGGTLVNNGTLDIQVNSGMSSVSGTLTGSGTTNIATDISLPAILTISGGTLDAHTLNINGKAKLTGSWSINNGATVAISSTGIFDIQSLGPVSTSGGGQINNSGKVEKTAGAGGTNIVPPLNNNNLVKVVTGDLVMNGTHNNATFDINTGSKIELAGTVQGNSSATGTGALKIVSTLTIDNGATFNIVNLVMSGGVLQGPASGAGTMPVSGAIQFDGGTWQRDLYVQMLTGSTLDFTFVGATTLTDDTRVTNAGTINLIGTSPVLSINDASYIQNNNILNLVGDVTINSDDVNNPRIDNSSGATILKTTGLGTATFNINLNNSGIVQSNSAGITFTRSGTHTGTFKICNGCVFDWAGGSQTLDGTLIEYVNPTDFPVAKLSGATFDVTVNGAQIATGYKFIHTAGTITGAGTLEIFAEYHWSGGTQSGAGDTQLANNNHTFDGANGAMILDGRTLTNSGTVTYAPVGANYLAINNGAVLTNAASTIVLTNDAPILSDGTGTIENVAGTIAKTAGTGLSRIAAIVNSYNPIIIIGSSRGLKPTGLAPAATIDASSGQIALNGGGFNAGRIFVPNAANAIVIEAGVYFFNSGTTFNTLDLGVIRVDGGELDMGAPMSIKNVELLSGILCGADLTITNKLVWKGGSIEGPGNTYIAATATLSHLAPTLPTFLDGRTLSNLGIIEYEGTGLTLMNGALLSNGGEFRGRDGAILSGTGGGSINNGGTLRKNAGVSGMRFDVPVTTNGTVSSEVSGQSLIFAGGGTLMAGSLTTSAGALIDIFSGGFSVDGGSLTGAGRIRVNGGALSISLPFVAATTVEIQSGSVNVAPGFSFQVPTLLFNGGSLVGPGGTLRAMGGSIGNVAQTQLSGDSTLDIEGAFSYNADSANFLVINDTSNLNIGSGVTFSLTTNGVLAGAPGASVINAGTFTKTGGIGISQITAPFMSTPSGVVSAATGTLQFDGGGVVSSQIDIATGATVAFAAGSYSLNAGASVTGNGTFSVQGATVNNGAPLTIPKLSFTAGTIGGTFNLTLTVTDWTAGTFTGTGGLIAGSQFNTSTTGTKTLDCALTNNGVMHVKDGNIGGSGTVLNNGGFNRIDNDTITFAPAFTNASFASFFFGSIAFNGGFTQTAGQTMVSGGTFSSPTTVNLNGGTLIGTGTVNASVTNNGATVAPGLSPGILTIAGNYSQSPSGILNIELGGTTPGTGYDRLVVTGGATIAGTVNVTLINTFTLSAGDLFDVVTYASHSGNFSPENLPPFPGGSFASTYTPTSYQLAATIPTAGDIEVIKTGPANASAGDIINYTIKVKNLGPSAATGVVLNDPTPPGLIFEANTGDCTTPFPCSLGTLAVNDVRTIVATYRVDITSGGSTIVNTASLGNTDPNNTNNSSSASTLISCPNVPPTNLKPAGSGAPTSGTLTWDPAGAEVYEVFLGPKGSGCTMSFGKTLTNSLAYSGLLPNTEYEWRVESSFDSCPVQSSTCVTFKTDECAIADAPLARVIGEATSTKAYKLEWDPVTNATRYEVEESTNADFTAAVKTTVVNATSLQFSHEVTQPDDWWYRVTAFTDCNDQASPASIPIRIVIVPPPAPTDPNPTFTIPVGSQEVIVQKIFIPGQPVQTLLYSATSDREWLYPTPPTGPVGPDGTFIDVIIDPKKIEKNGTFTGTIIVTLNAGETGRLVPNATTVSTSISVNLVTPITPVSKGGASQYALIVPAVGHLPGVDSAWRSDVRITNAGFRSVKYRLTFTPAAGSAKGVKQTDITIDAGDTTALDDIVKSWYGFGSLNDGESGALEIVPLDDPANTSLVTVASSRTYNATKSGTLGQFVPAIPFPSFIGRAAQGALAQILSIQQIAQTASMRTNFGATEAAGKSANLLVSVFNATGTKVLELPQTLAAGQQLQLNAFLAANNITLNDGRVEVKVTGGDGKITAYASVVDNGTGDPLLSSGIPLLQGGATRYVLPGAANTNTGFADWRTDMRIFNYGNVQQTATLTFFPQGGGTPRTAEILAKVGEVLTLDNVVKTLFNGDNLGGAIHVTTSQPASFIVSGRTYNQTSAGTLGQFISAVTLDQGIGVGGRSLNILQVEDSVRYRANIGVHEMSGKPATVELQIVLPESKITPTVQIPLAANEYRQFNPIRDLGLGNVYNARIAVRVISGDGRVTAFGSLIDEHTGDPAFLPGQ